MVHWCIWKFRWGFRTGVGKDPPALISPHISHIQTNQGPVQWTATGFGDVPPDTTGWESEEDLQWLWTIWANFALEDFSEGGVRCNSSTFYNDEMFRKSETAHRASSFHSLLQFQHQQAAWLDSLRLNPAGRCSVRSFAVHIRFYDDSFVCLFVTITKKN